MHFERLNYVYILFFRFARQELQFFETVLGDVPINVAQDALEKHIQESCKGNFEVPLLNCLQLVSI